MRWSDYELQPAPEFLFKRRPLEHRPTESTGPQARLVIADANAPAFEAFRREERRMAASNGGGLTITSDPGNHVVVLGGYGPDWLLFFSTQARAHSQDEADALVPARALTLSGSTVSLSSPAPFADSPYGHSELVVEGPADAPLVVHESYASCEIRDMTGPVRVAATHARATLLDTKGQVDVTAGVVDFSGSSGRVTLSSESEINLRIPNATFGGTLLAWAQRCVRVLVAEPFATPFEVAVNAKDAFRCRVATESHVEHARQGALHVFRCGWNPSQRPACLLHLRSEQSTVVMDPVGGARR